MTTQNICKEMTTTDPLASLPNEHPTTGNMDTEMRTTNTFASLPDAIFSNILEYLDWGDVVRFDTAFLNRETRNSYLFAVKLRLGKVKVEDKSSGGRLVIEEY